MTTAELIQLGLSLGMFLLGHSQILPALLADLQGNKTPVVPVPSPVVPVVPFPSVPVSPAVPLLANHPIINQVIAAALQLLAAQASAQASSVVLPGQVPVTPATPFGH